MAQTTEDILDKVMSPSSSYYEILGVEQSANDQQIRSAYRRRALRFHSDKYKGPRVELANDAFLRLAAAVEFLEDGDTRRAYDETLGPRPTPNDQAPRAPPSAPPRAPPSAPPSAPPRAPPSAPPSAPPRAPPSAPPSAPPRAPPSAPPSAPPPRRLHREFNAMYVFLSHARDALQAGQNVDNVMPVVAAGAIHIAVDLIAFITTHYPELAAVLAIVALVFGGLFAVNNTPAQRQAEIDKISWSSLSVETKLLFLNVMVTFYDSKRHL